MSARTAATPPGPAADLAAPDTPSPRVASTDIAPPGVAGAWHLAQDDVPVAVAVPPPTDGDADGDPAPAPVAVAGADGSVVVADGSSGRVEGRFAVSGGALCLAWAPGGRHLAVGGPGGAALWDRATQQVRTPGTGRWCASLAWAAPDRLAVADGRRADVVATDGRLLWRTPEVASTVTALQWLHGGRRLAVAAYGGVSCFLPARPGPVASYPFQGSLLTLAAAPSERWLSSGNQDASISVWRTRDGEELAMGGYPAKVTRLAFDATSRWLAANGAPEVTVWDFAGKGPAGSAPRVLKRHDAVTALAWQPGGGAVLASGGAEGAVAVWRPTRGLPSRPQRPVAEWDVGAPVTDLTWAGPDRLVVADRSGIVRCLAAALP